VGVVLRGDRVEGVDASGFSRSGDPREGAMDGCHNIGVGLLPDEAHRGSKVAGADENAVHTRRFGDCARVVHTFDRFDQTLAYLEGAATALAAPHLRAKDLREAHQLNQAMAEHLRDFDPIGFTRRNEQFHALLYGRCPNRHFQTLIHRECERMNLIRRSTFTFVPGRAQASVQEHEGILRLIETGAAAIDIEVAAREHKLNTLRVFLEHEAKGQH
jgi:DNA-binding FadR family transcriptional regulator